VAGPGCSTRRWCATVTSPFGHGGVDFPGGKYPNLFLVWGSAVLGPYDRGEREGGFGILDALKDKEVDSQTLARVKTQARAALLRQLDNNPGMAEQLTFYRVITATGEKMLRASTISQGHGR